MRRLLLTLAAIFLALPATAGAAGWSAVRLPAGAHLGAVSCRSTSWCEGVGGNETGRWNGRRWAARHDLPHVRGGSVTAISCRSERSCVAVGQADPGPRDPIEPLIERFDGHHWRVQPAPKPQPARGDRGVNAILTSVACPGARLCFAVGFTLPYGVGNGPGQPLVERWNGRYWTVVLVPYGPSRLTSISCTSARACTAVGSSEQTTVERWNGRAWSLGSYTDPSANQIGGLLGVSCTSAARCLGVGDQRDATTLEAQALAAPGQVGSFTATPLPFPAATYRAGASLPPQTELASVSCAPGAAPFCVAVGRFSADDGSEGPLAATWNGSAWTQDALRAGPRRILTSVSCPASGWCMAVGGTTAERLR